MLVEDHAAFRQSLALLLSREPDLEVVAQAGSLAEARELLDTPLDVAVLDLSLPDGDGRELIGELHRANAGISVLVLCVTIRPGRLEEVLKAGGRGGAPQGGVPRDHRRGGKALGWWMSHPQARRSLVLAFPRTSYYSRTSENSPSMRLGK
jgi:DNA-binding NarL/FixJ family response regulator